MDKQKDRHLEAPGEANRDKHINFLAEESGDVDPASEDFNEDDADDNTETGVDNGFFTDDNNRLQTKEEYDADKSKRPDQPGKVIPFEPDTTTLTPGDKISINKDNGDILSPVKDDEANPYINEDGQAH